MVLEGLGNIDLSGVSGYINVQYSNYAQYIPAIIISFGVLFFLFLFGMGIMSMCSTSKSKKYREEIVDLYVIGTVKKFAKEDGIDLEEEYKAFKKDLKREKLERKGLDSAIEEELKEQVVAKQEEKLSKKKQDKK